MPATFTGNHLLPIYRQYEYACACKKRDYYQLAIGCIYNEERFLLLRRLFPSELYPASFADKLHARVVLRYSEQPFLTIYYQNGKTRNCTFEQLNDYQLAKDTLLDPSEEHLYRTVLIGLPLSNLPDRLHVVLPPPLAASSNDTVMVNDLISSDLSLLCIPPMLALANPQKHGNAWQIRKLFSLLNHSFYQNYLLVVQGADNKQKQAIRDALHPYIPSNRLFDEQLYILSGGLFKSEERALERIIQELNARTKAFFQRARSYRCRMLLDSMAAINQRLIQHKNQDIALLKRTNEARQSRIQTAKQLSHSFYHSFETQLQLFNEKNRGLLNLENRCRNKLRYNIHIRDLHIIRVDVYALLHQEITSYFQALNRILCSQRGYSTLRPFLSRVEWDLGTVFSSIRTVEFQAKKYSFVKRGHGFRQRIINLLAEDILRILMANIKKEHRRFLQSLNKALDEYANRFYNSIPIIETSEIEKSVQLLTNQQKKLEQKALEFSYTK